MAEPIVATYGQQDDDWVITVSGHGKKLTARAPGIIAARDRADQLVEELGAGQVTVVHLLNGSALEFTQTYMTARLTRSEPSPAAETPDAANIPQTKSDRRHKAKLTADIGDALTARRHAKEPAPSTDVAEAAAPSP